jgi:hypothetical protein
MKVEMGPNLMITWQYYPKCDCIPKGLQEIIKVFNENCQDIDSSSHTLNSNGVLLIIKQGLRDSGFIVENGTKIADRIKVPVLFGRDGHLEKSFLVDAYNEEKGIVIEVEAGRAVTNYQFLKDLFEACMMHNVNYLAIAVRKKYRNNPDFEKVVTHFDTLYANGRLKLPLAGVLVIGY